MQRITVAHGDGIGPEIMEATLAILKAAKVPLEFDPIAIGESVYKKGVTSGIAPESWKLIHQNKVMLKAPITTPQGKGYKSLNVTMRKTLGLFANVRPCKAYTPYVSCNFPNMNMVIVRENEEDLYSGIEHQQTGEVYQTLKLISRPGSESIIRYAFEYARIYGHKKITCMTKDNIMKKADGLFHNIFDEVAKEYPDIQNEHMIIDIGAAKIAAQPEQFDMIVTLNLYGDIISDIAALVAGSVGLAGSANVGRDYAMFEAIHGSAPDIAGQGIANPSGLLNAACQMLVHVGLPKYAEDIANAWLKTLEDGIHTGDIYKEGLSIKRVDTQDFAKAVIERLGQRPSQLSAVNYGKDGQCILLPAYKEHKVEKTLVGCDIFLDWHPPLPRNPFELGVQLESSLPADIKLRMISNRGLKVYPGEETSTFCTDHWRCRMVSSQPNKPALSYTQIIEAMQSITKAGFEIIKSENLYNIDGEAAYSLSQGE